MMDAASEKAKLVLQELLTYSPGLYGGYYVDAMDSGIIHVNVPLNSKLILRTADNNVVYHTVNYTRDQLLSYKQAVSENLLGVNGVHLVANKIIENNLEIGIEDDSPEIITEIINVLNGLDIPRNAYSIVKRKRFSTLEKVLDNPIRIPKASTLSYDHRHTVMAGGWIGMGDSIDDIYDITSISSVTCGLIYNNIPGFLTCGHYRTVNKYMFWASPQYSGGSYPADLTSYSPNWIVPLGRVRLVDYSKQSSGYVCDLSSVEREQDTTIMAGHLYSGDTLTSCGVQPYVNATGYFTGCANRRVSCTVISDSADVIDMRNNQMKDLFFVDKPGISGTSGGPFYYKHVFNPNEFLVAGMACTTDYDSTTGFAKTDNALAKYNFIPGF